MTITSLFYLDENGSYEKEKPYFVSFPVDGLPEAKQTNIKHRQHDNIEIKDIRNETEVYNLDSSGFELVEFSSRFGAQEF